MLQSKNRYFGYLISNQLLVLVLQFLLFTSCGHSSSENTKDQHIIVTESVIPIKLVSNMVTQLSDNIRTLFQDSKNNYWFGTDGLGVYRFDGNKIVLFNEEDGLANNQIFNIQEDDAGNIWFNTPLGVSKFDGKKMVTLADTGSSHVKSSTGYNLNLSTSDLWFGAGGGAYRFDGKKLNYIFLPIRKESSNISSLVMAVRPFTQPALANTVYCSYKDKKGNIWFGTQAEGVIRFDGKEFTWLSDNGLAGPAVRAIFEDSQGNFWFGNNGSGLFKFDGKQLTNITKAFHLENEMFVLSGLSKSGTMAKIWAIEEDNAGDIWVGTIDCGLWRFNGIKFINYTTNEGLTSDIIQAIYKDKYGKLWFGTDGGGVFCWNGKEFKKFE